jgi:uncharacterized protein YegL
VDGDPRMPGGRIASRPLHFIWLVDRSGSMGYEGKIQALNHAIREAVPHMVEAAASQPQAEVLSRVITFSDGARWITPQPVPIEDFAWTDLDAGGTTDLGRALEMVAEVLRVPPMSERALPPVLVLISDGQPTDDFEAGLASLLREPWGMRSLRMSIAIGRDADEDVLRRFMSESDRGPILASNPEQLVRSVRWASTLIGSVSRPPRVGTESELGLAPSPDPPIGDVVW